MANETSLDDMKTALEELYKANPHMLDGLRTTTDPAIITKEYYKNLPKMIKMELATDADIINQEPRYYMQEFSFAEALAASSGSGSGSGKDAQFKYAIAASLFKQYESKQQDIYRILQENDPALLLELSPEDPNADFLNIFAADSTYGKDRICFKTKQEIQCENVNPTVESYIVQANKDWTRTPFFNTKYNTYVEKKSRLALYKRIPCGR